MKYLIGEIGFSLLIAGLIGLLIGWMISQLLKSSSLRRAGNHHAGELRDREHEISRLRSELHRRDAGGRSTGSRSTGDRSRRAASNTHRERATGKEVGSRSDQMAKDTARRTANDTARVKRPAIPQPGSSAASKSAGNYSVAAKSMRDNSASLRVRQSSASESSNKGMSQAVDDEAYAKIKALAALGERDRQLQYAHVSAPAQADTKNIDQYQKLLDQKNTQVDDLQRKIRDLLAAQSKATSVSSSSNVRERQLQSNYEHESYEKVRAFAGWGEAERKLSLLSIGNTDSAPDVESDLSPLRDKIGQQDAIITDLRNRLASQQQQYDSSRLEYERKISTTTLRADAGNDNSRVEVESYKRKVSDLERAAQNRIKEFNTTLESRNQEYDRLGNRLEELRKQVADRDAQIIKLKRDVESNLSFKSTADSDLNKYREQLGSLEIDIKERDASIARLQGKADELDNSNIAIREMEDRLAGFTRTSEETSKKYEGIINEQRNRIAELESNIGNLRDTVAQRDKEIIPLKQKLEEDENKLTTVTADVNRFRTEVSGRDSELKKLKFDLDALRKAETSLKRDKSDADSKVVNLSKELESARKATADARGHLFSSIVFSLGDLREGCWFLKGVR